MRRTHKLLLVVARLAGLPAFTQNSVPEIPYDSQPDALKLPDNVFLGENVGIATNSKGNVFVFTRTGHPFLTLGTARPFAHGGSKLFEFDKTGRFIREIG